MAEVNDEQYFVLVFRGKARPQYVRSIGPFSDVETAVDQYTQEDLSAETSDGDWATVVPDPGERARVRL